MHCDRDFQGNFRGATAMADKTPLPQTPKRDVDMERPGRARENSQGGSPAKSRRAEGEGHITADLMRSLLAEQHASLLQAQKQAVKDGMEEAVRQFETRQEERFQQVDLRAQEQHNRMEKMEKGWEDLLKRLHALEAGSTTAPSSSGGSVGESNRTGTGTR